MSDTGTDLGDEQESDTIKQLRERAKVATRLEKENCFLHAGIDLTHPLNQFFFAGYDGELTKEAIIARQTELGIDKATAPTPEVTPPPPAQADDGGQQAIRDLISGGQPAGNADTPPVDSNRRVWEDFNRNKGAMPLETAQLTIIDEVLAGAGHGDKAFIFDEAEWIRERATEGHNFRGAGKAT